MQNTQDRRSYAIYRQGLAFDRLFAACTRKEKDQAARWAAAWGAKTGILPFPPGQ